METGVKKGYVVRPARLVSLSPAGAVLEWVNATDKNKHRIEIAKWAEFLKKITLNC
jgi:hypothetical protein